jgi:hypothetical protein
MRFILLLFPKNSGAWGLLTSMERKPRMPHIRGIKGEAVPPLAGLQALDNKGDGVLLAFPKGKQKREEITESIFHRW